MIFLHKFIVRKKEMTYALFLQHKKIFALIFLLVFNIVNKENVEETKKKIELYKKENEKLIKKNQSKLVSGLLIKCAFKSVLI